MMNSVEEERGPLFKGAGTPAWWPRGGAPGQAGGNGAPAWAGRRERRAPSPHPPCCQVALHWFLNYTQISF